MKEYNNEFFKIIYRNDDKYINDIIEVLEKRTKDIANYFGINKVEEPIIIKMYYSIEEFKNYLIPYLKDGKYYDWMIASTHDGNINVLTLDECRKTKSHNDRTLKQFLDGIMHEVVHKMHHIIKGNNKTKNAWFHEALATNLSNQEYSECDITCTLDELKTKYNEIPNSYSISYTIGKYLLENYSHDFVISLCKDETILDEFAPKLFNEVANIKRIKR